MKQIYNKGYELKKRGIMVVGLTSQSLQQLNMFEPCKANHVQLMSIIDKLNGKYRENTLNITNQLDSSWAMRQNNLSPNYTTDIHIITVNCNVEDSISSLN